MSFKSLINRNLQGKKVLILFILTTVVYLVMLFVTIPMVTHHSNGMQLLDMMPAGYDSDYVEALLATLGEEGRNAYLYYQIPMDLIYPGLFGISYCLILAFFLNKLDRLDGPLLYLCLLPLVAGGADYLENAGIIILLTNYPDLTPAMVKVTNLASILKSSMTTIYFVVLLITLALVGIKTVRKK